MKKLLLIFVLFVQGSAVAQTPAPSVRLKEAISEFPRSQLQLKTSGPVSIEVNQGARAAYEALAEMAGLNILLDPDFRSSPSAPFRIENADILQAFDLLSARTGSFVEVLNGRTVILSPDNATKRRDYELEVLKTFYLPNGTTGRGLSDIVTTLRTTLNVRYIALSTTANAIVMRDTPDRIALAERTMALSARIVGSAPAATNGEMISGNGRIFTLEGEAVHESTPGRAALKPIATGPVSLDVKESTREAFERLARMAGLNVIFDLDFSSQDAQTFKVENVNILEAIDLLALQTRTFWETLDSKTIMVAPDSQSKRRDFENVLVKVFYVPNTSALELTEIVTALRTILNCRFLAIAASANAIVMRDNPVRIALAERIIADLRKAGDIAGGAALSSGSDSGFILARRAARTLMTSPSPLPTPAGGAFSFDLNDSARASYEAVAAIAGLRVVFDDRFKDSAAAPFKLQSTDIVDALDFLSLQTRNIWQGMDRDTILVTPDNPTVRKDLETRTTKTIRLTRVQPQGINEIVTALRTVLGLRQIAALENSIVMQDTAENIASPKGSYLI